MDSYPVCPERLDPDCPEKLDPDPVCPARLDPDTDLVNIRPDLKPGHNDYVIFVYIF